jgi:hypothetical protein
LYGELFAIIVLMTPDLVFIPSEIYAEPNGLVQSILLARNGLKIQQRLNKDNRTISLQQKQIEYIYLLALNNVQNVKTVSTSQRRED